MPSTGVRSPVQAGVKTRLPILETVYLPWLDNHVTVDPFAFYADGCQPADGMDTDMDTPLVVDRLAVLQSMILEIDIVSSYDVNITSF